MKNLTAIEEEDEPEYLDFRTAAERDRFRELARRARAMQRLAPKVSDAPPVLSTNSGFQVESVAHLLAKPQKPMEWLWHDHLSAGTVSTLVALPKEGKSAFARHLAFCVVNGLPFLGQAVKQGRVVYLAFEGVRASILDSFKKLGASNLDRLYVAPYASVGDAIDLMREHRPALMVVDTLFRLCCLRNEHSYGQAMEMITPLLKVAEETGTHILLLHHAGKIPRKSAILAGIGSIAFAGNASTHMLMRRLDDRGGTRTLESRQREGADLPETVLEFDKVTGRYTIGCTREEFEAGILEEQFQHSLEASSNATEVELVGSVVGRTGKKRKALRNLVAEGKIVRKGSGKRGKPYRYRNSRSLVPTSKRK